MNALNSKSVALFNLEKFEECIINVDKALTIDPKNMNALNIKIRAFSKL